MGREVKPGDREEGLKTLRHQTQREKSTVPDTRNGIHEPRKEALHHGGYMFRPVGVNSGGLGGRTNRGGNVFSTCFL